MMSMLLTLLFTYLAFFSLGEFGLFHCLWGITVNPALVTSDNPGQEGCIVGGNLMKLVTDIDTLLLLISCRSWAQIWQRNDACPNQQSESVGMFHNQFRYHQQGLEWFDVDPHK
jgi:hypothetical protein